MADDPEIEQRRNRCEKLFSEFSGARTEFNRTFEEAQTLRNDIIRLKNEANNINEQLQNLGGPSGPGRPSSVDRRRRRRGRFGSSFGRDVFEAVIDSATTGRERARLNNQLGTVQRELRDAQARLSRAENELENLRTDFEDFWEKRERFQCDTVGFSSGLWEVINF